MGLERREDEIPENFLAMGNLMRTVPR